MWGLEQMISYKSGDSIRIMADSFKSRRRLYPMNFYDFPFSAPDKEIVDSFKKKENLGEILLGHRLVPTNFEVKVLENTPNWVKTNTVPLNTIGTRAKLYSLLVNRYRSSFFLDGLPALVETGDRKYNGVSFQMGKKADKGFVLNNAFHFKIFYSTVSDYADLVVITRVVVAASSVSDADPEEPLYLSVNMLREEPKVPFTTYYKVSWEESDDEVTWKTRWDVYATLIRPRRDKGHYLSTAFSILLVCFLGTLVALVLARTVRRDLLDMTDGDTREDLREEKGWKLVRGDVFRTPKNAGILSSLIGGGCQLLAMIAVTSIASVVGILHPSQRGNLLTGLIMFFIVSSSIAGFVVSTMLRYFGQVSFKKALLYSLYLPISIFSGYLCLNMLHWWRHSTTAIPLHHLY
ncbi:endosomal integral membrane protein [Angomonas deanei]|uniref:Transmembrane 9 superfamily member n=1 Tax=Angomonas deanei TaxID=59799 RepID=A0A7G2C534_9TRYP|nr:endosomal integral membrane protein [Angomonas deanei]CAD2214836.1 Endomembrane protein 70, putative [Angomonas deanei]|eukprot:EPY24984.1 endosomal integral membrane protein [Angomonas deanei]